MRSFCFTLHVLTLPITGNPAFTHIANWPYKGDPEMECEIRAIIKTHKANVLQGYDIRSKLIKPKYWESNLCGTTVLVHFNLVR